MRRIVLTYIFLSVIGIWGAMAQNTLNPMNNRDRFGNQIDPNTQPDNLEDSTNTEIQSLPPKLYMWKLSETLGNRTIIPADTASLNFASKSRSTYGGNESGTTGERGIPAFHVEGDIRTTRLY